jgi:hypothetical protein
MVPRSKAAKRVVSSVMVVGVGVEQRYDRTASPESPSPRHAHRIGAAKIVVQGARFPEGTLKLSYR